MSGAAFEILRQFKKLSATEQREVIRTLLEESSPPSSPEKPLKSISELRTFVPTPCAGLKDHDRWFAQAILASKGNKPSE